MKRTHAMILQVIVREKLTYTRHDITSHSSGKVNFRNRVTSPALHNILKTHGDVRWRTQHIYLFLHSRSRESIIDRGNPAFSIKIHFELHNDVE